MPLLLLHGRRLIAPLAWHPVDLPVPGTLWICQYMGPEFCVLLCPVVGHSISALLGLRRIKDSDSLHKALQSFLFGVLKLGALQTDRPAGILTGLFHGKLESSNVCWDFISCSISHFLVEVSTPHPEFLHFRSLMEGSEPDGGQSPILASLTVS